MAKPRGLTSSRAFAAVLSGLPPQIAPDCRVLVLGSMPGAASLSAARYYAHPRNRFWPMMSRVCGLDANADYAQRIAALNACGIGLWDVIGECERQGSLDSRIVAATEIANPLARQLLALKELRTIAFNGGKAAQAFARHVAPDLDVEMRARWRMRTLPSTSPANAAFDLERLHAQWRILVEDLRQ